MCRLLYIRSENEFNMSEQLEKFAHISKISKEYQGHGWGYAWLENNKWKYYKNINPIWEDDFSNFGYSRLLIAHARSAFKNKDIVVENNMPFYDDNFVFIFNGELRKVKIKSEGRIGAEKIFNFIKRFYKNDMLSALQKGRSIISKRTEYIRAMNIIIANKDKAFVSSQFSEDPDYFTLQYKIENGITTICSQKLDDSDNWKSLANNFIGVL